MRSPAPTFLALEPDAAREQIVALGGRPFHADVVRREVFERGVLAYDAMSGLGKDLRRRLTDELPLVSAVEAARSTAGDGTRKILLRFPDGEGVEVVHIPSRRADRDATLCVSSQVGCPVGCPFCASGANGLARQLAAHEIVEQFLLGRVVGPLSRAVVMGIGEPLLNIDAVVQALETVRTELGLGARRLTVSTVGFPARLRRLARRKPRFQLAISLHSPFDDERATLVPAMADTPVEEVLAAGDDWFEVTGREVTYEYVLLGGTNDTPTHADRLVALLARRRATVNMIPFNAVPGGPYRAPDPGDPERFRDRLIEGGVVATIRRSRGSSSDAACGQLRARR